MTQPPESRPAALESYRSYLRLLAGLHLGPRIRRKIDPSDLVQLTLLKAHEAAGRCPVAGETALAGWLRLILARTMADEARRYSRGKRDVELERSLVAGLDQSSARLEPWLADDGSTPSQQAMRHEQLVAAQPRPLDALPDDRAPRPVEAAPLELAARWPKIGAAGSAGAMAVGRRAPLRLHKDQGPPRAHMTRGIPEVRRAMHPT